MISLDNESGPRNLGAVPGDLVPVPGNHEINTLLTHPQSTEWWQVKSISGKTGYLRGSLIVLTGKWSERYFARNIKQKTFLARA